MAMPAARAPAIARSTSLFLSPVLERGIGIGPREKDDIHPHGATKNSVKWVLSNVGLERASAYAKSRSDFFDREQFGCNVIVHGAIPVRAQARVRWCTEPLKSYLGG
jgi:hypothetical protein